MAGIQRDCEKSTFLLPTQLLTFATKPIWLKLCAHNKPYD
jgi:hypothetical protein